MRRPPHGWAEAKLVELFELKYGKALPDKVRDGAGFPVFGSNGIVGSHSVPLTDGETLIIGRKGSVGEVQYSAGPCSPIDTTYYIDNLCGMPFHFWLHFLRHLKLQDLNKATAIPGLSREDAYKLPIYLPPLNEQKRIADKLDALLARVDACRERLDNVPVILNHFRQTILSAATSGQLTEEWRATKNLPVWKKEVLNNLCRSITDGDHQAPPQVAEGIPFITIAAINDRRLNLEKATRFVPTSYYDQLKPSRKPEKGDVLFSVTGSIAIPAIVDVTDQFTFQRHIAILKPELTRVSSKYLFYLLGSETIKEQSLAVATGTAQLTIPLSGLRSFTVYLPPKEEQEEIVSRIDTLFAFIERLVARYTVGREKIENLTSALLAVAFRGELVPQDPDDEPAEKLLERIRATKSVVPKFKRRPAKSTAQRKKIAMKTKSVSELTELVAVLDSLAGEASPERLIAESGLVENVDLFFELLREGRDQHILEVPVGSNDPIRRKTNAHR